MDIESGNQLSFLDILVSRSDGNFVTGIFRKSTFTGLGLNFFSHCSFGFKTNSCKTLLHRAFSLCSNWSTFHTFTQKFLLSNDFNKNCYPSHIFSNLTKKFLDNIFQPKLLSFNKRYYKFSNINSSKFSKAHFNWR